MKDAIGQVLSLGVGVAISPVPIIAVVLMLATPRARSNGPAFLLGWVIGLAAVGTIVLLATNGANPDDGGEPATWVGIVKLALGLLLLALGVKQWRGRPKGDHPPDPPKWMKTIDSFTPPKAFGMGVLLSGINPKNLLLTIAAATAISATGISTGDEFIALAIFVVIGTLGVAAPIVIYFGLGDRSQDILQRLNGFLAANNAVIMAVLILLIGVKLIGDGIAGL